jgi:hypothetical protein
MLKIKINKEDNYLKDTTFISSKIKGFRAPRK